MYVNIFRNWINSCHCFCTICKMWIIQRWETIVILQCCQIPCKYFWIISCHQLKCLLFKKGQNLEVQVFFINKKYTIFVQFCSNFQGLIRPWVGQSLKVWAKSDKNCRFFINGEKNLHCYILTFLIQQTF